MLAGVNCVIGGWSINRYQPRLEGSTVIANAINRQFMLAEVEHLRDVAFILLAMFQSIEVTVAKGDFRPNPSPVGWIGRAPPRNQIQVTIVAGEADHRLNAITEAKSDGGVH